MASKVVSVSLVNHHPYWDNLPEQPAEIKLPRHEIGCTLYYVGSTKPYTFPVYNKVQYGEDYTTDFELLDGQVQGAEFFWFEVIGDSIVRRLAWYDLPRTEQGKPWAWLGMFWLFDIVGDLPTNEQLAALRHGNSKRGDSPDPIITSELQALAHSALLSGYRFMGANYASIVLYTSCGNRTRFAFGCRLRLQRLDLGAFCQNSADGGRDG